MGIMKTIYKNELRAARRLRSWVDGHPHTTNAFIAVTGILCALYVFFYV